MTSEEFRNNPMFLRNQFKSDGTFGIPVIKSQKIDMKNISFIGYDQIKLHDHKNKNKYVHFFWTIISLR